ncbi:NAD(P)H-binding protein [Loktanella sp. SALINAS62]|uniref:NAD(P)H-binding protein n=1 Tax=Loktanella sp. SALINAS62 TaxID=2706124 RepID=UPI001B8AD505|nr:NAD(P)H-binding protein [Loktanella sp. SALINAS62]MBS1301223.1 NAD(P)H-binding protein [Loktanella sp. SALINAS62]
MSHVFIIGATGGVGSRLIPLLTAAGHRVSGLHRKPEQADDLRAQGVIPVQGDLMKMDADAMTQATKRADIVVFSAGAAGSGDERATVIDGDGPIKVLKAAQENAIRRLYVVSVIPDAGRGADLGDGFEHYMAEKRRADVAVAASDLDWVLLRPGTLQDADGDGQVTLGRAVAYGDVARGDVAATLAALIDTPDIHHETLELTGGDTPVDQAVAAIRR